MDKYSISNKRLEDLTYRQLQQMAKSMGLPSNYKKIYLIELIHAKVFKTDLHVHNIIHKVKQERLRLSKVKKQHKTRRYQILEGSNNISYSPPITVTPKRPSEMYMKYNPELRKAIVSLHPKRSLLENIEIKTNASSSDRVLRSYNLKTLKPNYALMNDMCTLKSKCRTKPTEMKFKIFTSDGSISQFNLSCYERNNATNRHTDNSKTVLKRKIILSNDRDLIQNPMPVKRQRTISGIYPLTPEECVPRSVSVIKNVCIRKVDGTYTTVNAVVQKNNMNLVPRKKIEYHNTNIQDIINESVDANLPNNTEINENNSYLRMLYPTISNNDSLRNNTVNNLIAANYKEYNTSDTSLIHYGQNIRAEQKLYAICDKQHSEQLPKIQDAFSQFNNIYKRDQNQPQQVRTEFGISNNPVRHNEIDVNCNNNILETIYNIKVNIPITPIFTTADTKCVYSTQIIVSPVMYQSTVLPPNDALNVSLLRRSSSLDTIQTCQELSGGVNIPEMVEDALEIISQDGDYIEQIGMGMKVQCVLCLWAGPKIMLECHVQKEHPHMIHKVFMSEWNMTFTLESVVQCSDWLHRVVEYDSVLYVLSAKHEDPDCFMAVLLSLSAEPEPIEKTASITIYNKITGEPFSWSGHILALPPNSYENISDCLRVDLSKLDLLPNSANLKLVNREFVTQSPSKVVVGQPVLNDIHIILFVTICDSLPYE